MGLFDGIFKKTYTATVFCNNCNSHSEVQIPRGVTIVQFVESGKCPNCSCVTLVVDYKQIDEFKKIDELAKSKIPRMQIIRKRPRPPTEPVQTAPIPEPRYSTKHKRFRPLPRSQEPPPIEPKKIFKQDPVDFWTGKPNKDEGEEYQEDEDKNY